MPAFDTIFKGKKKRESQQKSPDASSKSPEQRSPSTSSTRMSVDSTLKQAQTGFQNHASNGFSSGLGGTAASVGHAATNGANRVSQSIQSGLQNGLNSPFMPNKGSPGAPHGSQAGNSLGVPKGAQGMPQNFQTSHGGPHGGSHGGPLGGPQAGPSGSVPQGNPQGISPHGVSPHGMPPAASSSGSRHGASPSVASSMASHAGPSTPHGAHRATPSADSPNSQSNGASSPTSLGPSDTPWAEYAIQRAAPSPRFGHSANYLAARDGELFIMGGIRDMDILSDLWVIDTKSLTGYQLMTDGVKVGPRVGHASLVLGNAHVVFGGDTKIDESDPLDDNLYLLNTSSLKWTVAATQGPRPCGRYGHSLSNVGARVYVFGGQVDEEFYDDMWTFDLTTWRSPTAHWERLEPATPPPPPRTNHTVVTFEDKLYLFGGANGDLWYSDTWCFDPVTREWEQLECSGYVPAPCQGHASTIIGDVMYVFGGMSSQGLLIDQLFALKLSTLKWYTFQNLGPGPSPRSGHSLTAFGGDKVLVWGGTDQGNSAYVLDVSRINYPDDAPTPSIEQSPARSVNSNARSVNSNLGRTPSTGTSLSSHTRGPSDTLGATPREPGFGAPLVAQGAAAQAAAQGASSQGAASQGAASEAATSKAATEPLNSSISSTPLGSAGPSSTIGVTKEVRQLQPHVYAPSSTDTGGPTSARSNPAARNSILISKRRSVLLPPGSPTRELDETRAPNRHGEQVRSYVTEEDQASSDERFVSATDLRDIREQGSSQGGHSRGLSFGIGHPTDTVLEEDRPETLTASSSEHFRKLESELDGMPGGLGKPLTTETVEADEESRQVAKDSADDYDDYGSKGYDSKDYNKEYARDEDDSAGLRIRRSQPQTNLAKSIDGLDESPQNADDPSYDVRDQQPVNASSPKSEQVDTWAKPSARTDATSKSVEDPRFASAAASAQAYTAQPSSAPTPSSAVEPSAPEPSELPSALPSSAPAAPSAPSASVARSASAAPAALPSTFSGSPAEEIAFLRRELDRYRQRDFSDEFHQLKQAHAAQQRELTGLKDANAQLTRKHAAAQSQNTDLKQRHDHMTTVIGGHIDTLKSQQSALDEANGKLASQQEALAQLTSLQAENADLKLKLKEAETSERAAKEQLDALNASYASLKSAHSDLSTRHLASRGSKDANGAPESQQVHNNVNHLVMVWDDFKNRVGVHANGDSRDALSKSAGAGSEDYKQLYEHQKAACERAQQDLTAAYSQESDLKAQLRELSTLCASSHSAAEVAGLKDAQQLKLQKLTKEHSKTMEELKSRSAAVEDLRADLNRVQTSLKELQAEYTKAIDLSRNQQAAVTRTREELNMARAHVTRLQEQLEDAKLQRGNDSTAGDISHSSMNDQAALVIRDLRAQIVLLEEELTDYRKQVMDLKKKALTKD